MISQSYRQLYGKLKHERPCKKKEKILYDQYEEKELYLHHQLQKALVDVIVVTSFGDSRPVDLWSDFHSQFSVVTFNDVAKGTDDLYSGQIPKGFEGTPTELVNNLNTKWQKHNELARAFFHKSDTQNQKKEENPTDGFQLMTEVNFYLQVIRIFKNLFKDPNLTNDSAIIQKIVTNLSKDNGYQ